MDRKRMPPDARKAALDLLDALQRAQFAARRLEAYYPAGRDDRLVDHIHALRLLAEHLRPA
jgi:hypothetical protein